MLGSKLLFWKPQPRSSLTGDWVSAPNGLGFFKGNLWDYFIMPCLLSGWEGRGIKHLD